MYVVGDTSSRTQLVRLTADGDVELSDGSGGWHVVRKSVGSVLFCFADSLCATDAQTGALYRSKVLPDAAGVQLGAWQRIGGPARRYEAGAYWLYRIPVAGNAIEVFDDTAATWVMQRTGPIGQLFGGPQTIAATVADVYASLPGEVPGQVLLKSPQYPYDWSVIRAAVRSLLLEPTGIYVVDPAGRVVERQEWNNGYTTAVGDAGYRLNAGSPIIRRDFDGNIWTYNDLFRTWRFIGQPP
jgi:hypothetical protein